MARSWHPTLAVTNCCERLHGRQRAVQFAECHPVRPDSARTTPDCFKPHLRVGQLRRTSSTPCLASHLPSAPTWPHVECCATRACLATALSRRPEGCVSARTGVGSGGGEGSSASHWHLGSTCVLAVRPVATFGAPRLDSPSWRLSGARCVSIPQDSTCTGCWEIMYWPTRTRTSG